MLHAARSSNRLSQRIRPSRPVHFLVHDRDILSLKIGIQYCDAMRTWKTVTPGGTSSANRIQWIDNGQPKTESFPSNRLSRFYRVITAQ